MASFWLGGSEGRPLDATVPQCSLMVCMTLVEDSMIPLTKLVKLKISKLKQFCVLLHC